MRARGKRKAFRIRRFEWKVIRIPFSLVQVLVILTMLAAGAAALAYYRRELPLDKVPLPAPLRALMRGMGFTVGSQPSAEAPTVTEQRTASLSFLTGDVKVQRAKEMNWISGELRMKLGQGDRVRTFDGARAEVSFDDGSLLRIKPDSLIIIGNLTENLKTKVRQSSVKLMVSSIEADIKRSVVDGSRFRLEMPSAVAEMSRARISVDVGPGEDSTVRVYSGRVSVDTGQKKVAMEEQTRISIGSAREVSAVSRLAGAPRMTGPPSLSRFIANDASKVSLLLQWEAVPNAARYHLQVDTDRRFGHPALDRNDLRVLERRVGGLGPGVYYARVSAVDVAGLEGGFSEPVVFMVALDRVPPEVAVTKFVSSHAAGGYDLLVEGTAEPGSEVALEGRQLVVDEQGRFSASLRGISTAGREVILTARDRAGNEKRLPLKVAGG